ncbi:uncharacterized protein LOC142350938 [Convolutriloba macropyga]|uniref:uncharacterized protein LOC142350938 n=1 Tax=Convolutriloba macropyga TaxID=536237 RepID=UPI003F52598C
MAPQPDCRFPTENKQFTFANCGLVFFGPFYIEEEKDKLEKHYGLIFTCLVTRAVHLETCPDLNTDTFLNAYRRFTSRRCQPADLYSDNGKTFVGAKEELKRCLNDLDKDKIHKALAAQNTKWHFNPPYGPHVGGAWERLIQSIKRALLIILGSRNFTFDVSHTIMVESEAMMNSRPLTNVPDAMENEEPLTPNHFLLQRPYNSLLPDIFPSTKPANMKSWEECSTIPQPHLEKTGPGIPTDLDKATKMNQKRPEFTQSQRCGVDPERLHPTWYLASGKSRSVPWTRW